MWNVVYSKYKTVLKSKKKNGESKFTGTHHSTEEQKKIKQKFDGNWQQAIGLNINGKNTEWAVIVTCKHGVSIHHLSGRFCLQTL